MSPIDRNVPLRGVIPPIVTPLTPDGSIDEESLERLVDFEIGAGVDALFVFGTGGEGPYLTAEAQQTALRAATRAVAGRVPVLVGISDVGTAKALAHLDAVSRFPIDAVVSTAPFYGPVGRAEIDLHFRTLSAATELPLYAYDIPAFTGVKIPEELTVELAHDDVIAGIKDTSGEEDGFRYVIEETRDLPGFSVITGSDITGDAAILQGAHGMIVGVANVDPHGYVKAYHAAEQGDWEAAQREQERLHRLRRITKIAASRIGSFSATIGAFKAAQVQRGIIDHDGLQQPLLKLNDEERARIAEVLGSQGLGTI